MSPRASGSRILLFQPSLGLEEEEAVLRVLRAGRLVQGPEVEALEDEFAGFTGSRHAIAVSSGSAALLLCLQALSIGSADEVVVPAYTFVATANAVKLAGARVICADVLTEALNLDPHSVEVVISSNCAAVIVVHQFGLPADVDAIAQVAGDLLVLEDAACAAGARVGSEMIGRPHGRAACFSFHARKTITTGEGGMITCSDRELADSLRLLRQHGLGSDALAVRAGCNFRMSEMAAAVGRVQLGRLPTLVARRRQAAQWYQERLSDLDWLIFPSQHDFPGHTFQSFLVRIRDHAPLSRKQLISHLRNSGIGCQAGVVPIHLHPAHLATARLSLQVSEQAGRSGLFLPMHAELSEQDVETVCQAIRAAGER